MSRALKKDYSELLEFIDNYTLKESYSNRDLERSIKPMHKGYYSALVLIAEINHQGVRPDIVSSKTRKDEQENIFWLYLNESLSELGSSFFLILNGCYKAAEQVLRSSIENFIKAYGSIEYHDFHKIKNVYEIFDQSGKTSFFSKGVGKHVHEQLNELYGNLCSTVHTGSEKELQRISALGDFPAIDSVRIALASKKYLKTVKLYVSSLSILFSKVFHSMHHKNRDIVDLSLDARARQSLHASECY